MSPLQERQTELIPRFFSGVAEAIRADCARTGQSVPIDAVPYLRAMECLCTNDPTARCGWMSARTISGKALAGLRGYKGATARALKAELRRMVGLV